MSFYGTSDDEYSDSYDYETGLTEDGRCPVCKATGGNCVGESDFHGSVRIIPARPGGDAMATFTVPERIYETKKVGSKTVRTLLYSKGQRIRPEEARRMGLIP